MTFDKDLVVAIIGALGTFVATSLSAYVMYRRAMAKIRTEIEATRVAHQKELMEAKAEFKQKSDDSDNQKAMIQAIIEQGKSARALADNVIKIVTAIEENTRATNKMAEKVDGSISETSKLDKDVDNFAAHLIRATKTMEETKNEIQTAGQKITKSGIETQENSTELAKSILTRIDAVKTDIEKYIDDKLVELRIDLLKAMQPPPQPDMPAPAPAPAVVEKLPIKAQSAPEGKPIESPN